MIMGNGKNYFVFFLLLFLGANILIAQNTPVLIESSTYFGSPLKHSPKILYDTRRFSIGQDVEIQWQTLGQKKWQEKHNYPRLGLQVLFMNIGEPDTLGISLGILPNISFYLIQQAKYNVRFQFSYGLAYLNKRYHDIDNPLNNAISSSINANVMVKLENQFQVHPKWWLKFGANLIHYSNGANKIPNLGINIGTFNVGLSYRPKPLDDFAKETAGIVRFNYSKWGGDLQMGVGYREREEARGPIYPIYNVAGAVVYRLNLTNHMRVGVEYEYNKGVFDFGKNIFLFNNDEEARQGATRWNVFYAHEFRFGALGLYLAMGSNIYKKSQLLNANIFNKYSVRYYLPTVGKPATSFYASINIKTNSTIAEYYSLSFGSTF